MTIDEVCKKYIDLFQKDADGREKIHLKLGSDMRPIEEDSLLANAIMDIMGVCDDGVEKKTMLYGKQSFHGSLATAYLDSLGSVIYVIRDTEKHEVDLYWVNSSRIKQTINTHLGE